MPRVSPTLPGKRGGKIYVIPTNGRNLKFLPARPVRSYYVYIMTNGARTLYVGVTNDLVRRVFQHKNHLVDGFTKKYNVTWLAFYEETSDVRSAIMREKEIKAWRRSKKVALIESRNPQWKELSLEWGIAWGQ